MAQRCRTCEIVSAPFDGARLQRRWPKRKREGETSDHEIHASRRVGVDLDARNGLPVPGATSSICPPRGAAAVQGGAGGVGGYQELRVRSRRSVGLVGGGVSQNPS